jgi:hypothetical protein
MYGPMKTLTIIAAGLVLTASSMPGSTIHLRRSALDDKANRADEPRVEHGPAKKETLKGSRTMIGLPRNG